MKINTLVKKIIIVGAAGLLALSMAGCSSKSKTTGAMEKESLILGFDDTFAPMGFKDESGEVVGFDIDIAKAVGEKLGKEMVFQPIDWTMKETELNNGNIDFIWNGYSITDKRKEQVAFSVPYLKNRQIILTLADSDIKAKADLAGKVVGAQTDSSAVDAINAEPELCASFDGGKPVTYESNNDVLMDLEAGRLDAVVADEILIRYYISKKGPENFNILEEDLGEEEYGVGMRKSETALVEAFNKAYGELKEEGKIAEISMKWFGEDISE